MFFLRIARQFLNKILKQKDKRKKYSVPGDARKEGQAALLILVQFFFSLFLFSYRLVICIVLFSLQHQVACFLVFNNGNEIFLQLQSLSTLSSLELAMEELTETQVRL